MTLTIHEDLVQGSDEWLAARCGILTASSMKLILTPTGKAASNDKERAYLFELLAQRLTGYVEPAFVNDDMLRGIEDEGDARDLYAQHYAPVQQIGFMTRDDLGFPIGYSPDGLVGDDGLIEIKSRRAKYQVETLIAGTMPADYAAQVQTGLWVSGRKWLDFISYSAGLPMAVVRVFPDPTLQEAILDAAELFERRLDARMAEYRARLAATKHVPTERKIRQEMYA